MTNQALADLEALRSVVRAINDRWRAKDYDRIGDLLAEEAVIAPPGFDQRVRGRNAYVQSYRDYDQAANTSEFWVGDPQIDLAGDVAVVISPFRVVYEIQSVRHREKGFDILVFSRSRGVWKVVWRTMQVEPTAE